jgi:hypothetical protein
MDRDGWIQLGILLSGCPAVMLLGIPESWIKWSWLKVLGSILGVLSQPLWFLYAYYHPSAWGIKALNYAYLCAWIAVAVTRLAPYVRSRFGPTRNKAMSEPNSAVN